MNNELIKKIIAISNGTCPEFVYQNPLLDRNVTNALSKSFIKILKISDQNSTTNNNLRLSILENIRKLCTIEPDGHSQVDDHFTELLTEIYQNNIACSTRGEDSVEKKLDAFLVRKLKNFDINSCSPTTLNPEVVQALINMNQNGVHLDTLSRDVIHWNIGSTRYFNVLKELWDHNAHTPSDLTDDICIKMKPQIEMLILDFCNNILATGDQNIDNLIKSNRDLMELIKKCSISSQCFQMCSGILNFIFIMTNFDKEMQKLIPAFINHVKVNCHLETPCPLYPLQLSSLVMLLDFDIHMLPEPLKSRYIQPTVSHLQKLHRESENDLILLLSHYPQWFDIYFNRQPCK